ncbi:MAG: hypothetical protein ACLSHU_13730 [Oscillospiraceae bacterium]
MPGCTRWETCWNREAEQTYALLNGAAPRLLDQRYIAPEDLPPAFLDRCRRPEAFLESINGALSGLRLRRQCRARLREGRMALGNQYRFLARYLQDTAQSLTEPEPQARYRVELGVSLGEAGSMPWHQETGGRTSRGLACGTMSCCATAWERDRGRPRRAKVRCVFSRGFCRRECLGRRLWEL